MAQLVMTFVPSPLGSLRLVAEGDHLVGVYFPEHAPAPDLGDARLVAGAEIPDVLAQACRELEAYFAGERVAFTAKLAPRHGTAFQHEVWALLRTIPYGEVWTYGALAARLGRPRAARAVGAANGLNPLSIVVPCHRVVGHGGALTGYAGGLAAKRFLLDHEARHAQRAAASARPPSAFVERACVAHALTVRIPASA